MGRLRLRAPDPTAIPRTVLLVGVVVCASVFDTSAVKPFDMTKVAALWFFAWLGVGLTMIDVVRGRIRLVRFKLGVVAGMFLLATGISTLFSQTRIVSFFGWYGKYNGFLEVLLYVVVFWLVVQMYWRRPERLREVFYAVAAASVVLTGYILVQWVGLDPVHWVQPNGQRAFRYFGTMGNANFAGGLLGASMGWFVFAYWRARRPLSRTLVVGWAGVTVFALWLTSSRGAFVAAVATALVAIVVFRERLPRWLFIGSMAVAGVVLLTVVAAIFRVKSPSQTIGSEGANTFGGPNVFRTNTLAFRTYWWKSALLIFAAHPITGTGPDTFIVVYPRYTVPAAAHTTGAQRTDAPHNIYLEHAASLGILGLGSYLALVFLAFRWGLRRMKSLQGVEAELLGSFLALLAGYLAQGFFSIDVAALVIIGWLALGGIAALADPRIAVARAAEAGEEEAAAAPRPSAARWAAVVLTGIVGLVVATSGLRPWLADRAAKTALRDAAATSSTDVVLRSYRRAIALAPYDPVYRGLAGSFLAQQALRSTDEDLQRDLLNQAVEYDKQMDTLQPGSPLWKMTVGTALGQLGSAGDDGAFEEAGSWFGDAEELAPRDNRVPLAYATVLNHWGLATHDGLKYCDAIVEFRKSITLLPTPDAWAGIAQALAAIGHLDEGQAALEKAKELDASFHSVRALSEHIAKLRGHKINVISCA
jgi:O-antigen ligase